MITEKPTSPQLNRLIPALFLTLTFIIGYGQNSPETYFGDDYFDAVRDCMDFKEHFKQAAIDFNLPPRVLVSIVFPELIRYNRFRDLAETAAVEHAYVRYGKDIADFSIGSFQMKPSFVEDLERHVKSDAGLQKSFRSVTKYSSADTIIIRKERVKRLKDPDWQMIYLACFTEIAMRKYNIRGMATSRQVQLLSAAYNRGLGSSLSSLEKHCLNKTFPYGKKLSTGFSYADVALHYYMKDSQSIL